MIAGPNGSGKTTLTDALRRSLDLGTYINTDEIALFLGGGSLGGGSAEERARRAQNQALQAVETALSAGRDFSFETVMSHPSKIYLLGRAWVSGFFVKLRFVSTSNPMINLTRVVARVQRGGHDVPPDKIKSRMSDPRAISTGPRNMPTKEPSSTIRYLTTFQAYPRSL